VLRHHLVPSRALYLNATGVPRRDEVCTEHNAILCAPDRRIRAIDLAALIPDRWDELFLPAIDRHAFPDLVDGAEQGGYRVRVDHAVASPYVDLDRVRAAPGGYLSLLGASTRAQLRRARRAFGPRELELDVAADWPQARAIFDELIFLHERTWRARGQVGAFGDPWFLRFHERLIDTRFRTGELQLLRLRAGTTTIGCLYNLIANGRVMFYQSGLGAFTDPHVKAGYLCHAAAVEHAARAGHAVYDLLGGVARYKQCLATDHVQLAWIRLQRPRTRFVVEDWLRAIVKGTQALAGTPDAT
jgi:hypothetical protein